eukprot:7139031-Pyramimonas_sp.AAC.1
MIIVVEAHSHHHTYGGVQPKLTHAGFASQTLRMTTSQRLKSRKLKAQRPKMQRTRSLKRLIQCSHSEKVGRLHCLCNVKIVSLVER